MKTALITGASGLVGKYLTDLILEDKRYSSLTLLTRKPLNLIHEKLVQVPFDFDKPDARAVSADDIFCCLGTTIKTAGSKAEFYKVDYEYVKMIARMGHANGSKRFALVSSLGANKNSMVFYNKTKGAVEEAVSDIGYEGCYIFRPSILLGRRSEFRFGETMGKLLIGTFAVALPRKYKPVPAVTVARKMIDVMNSGETGNKYIESDSIHQYT